MSEYKENLAFLKMELKQAKRKYKQVWKENSCYYNYDRRKHCKKEMEEVNNIKYKIDQLRFKHKYNVDSDVVSQRIERILSE